MSIDPIVLQKTLDNPFVHAILATFGGAAAMLLAVFFATAWQAVQVWRLERNCARAGEGGPDVLGLLRARLSRRSLARQRLEHAAARRAGEEVDLAALSEDAANRMHRWLAFPRYVSSVLVLLGLCGAVFGLYTVIPRLAAPLGDVQRALMAPVETKKYSAADDPAMKMFSTLTQTLQDSLQSTQGAFGASMTGILFTVMLIAGGWLVSFLVDGMLLYLDRITRDRLLPLFPAPSSAAAMSEVTRRLEQGSDRMSEAAERFSSGTASLARMGDAMTLQSSRLNETMSELYAFVEQFKDGARGISAANGQLQATQDRISGLVERFVDVAGEIVEAQRRSQQGLDGLGRQIADVLERVDRQATAHGMLRLGMEEGIQKSIHLVRELFDQRFLRLAESSADALDDKLDEHRSLIAAVQVKHEEFFEKLTDAVTRIKGHKQLLEGIQAIVDDQREMFREHLDRLVSADEARLSATVREATHADRRAFSDAMVGFHQALKTDLGVLAEAVRKSASGNGGGVATLVAAPGGNGHAVERPTLVAEAPPDPALARLAGLGAIVAPPVLLCSMVYLGTALQSQWAVVAGGGVALAGALGAWLRGWLR
jgi:hypothetical protein